MNFKRRMVGFTTAFVMTATAVFSPRSSAAVEPQETKCFDTPGITNCLEGNFLTYWNTNGGLPVFGFPITAKTDEHNKDTNKMHPTQWLERNRFEYHDENKGTSFEVLLGLLGKERLAQMGRDYAAEPRESGPKAGCLWFEQTGHNVCNIDGNLGFKTYWETHGLKIAGMSKYDQSLQLFGFPLTEPKMETNSSGDTVLTQWFERARFEWHPNNPADFKVLLGLLGKEVQDGKMQPPPAGACGNVPASVSATVKPSNCVDAGMVLEFSFYGFQANEEVGFWFTDPTGAIVGTADTVNIGPTGRIDGLPIPTNDFDSGIWQFTMQGTTSKHVATAYFGIKPSAPNPPTTNVCEKVPASVSANVTPSNCVDAGVQLQMDFYGFQANEKVGYWLTAPTGEMVGTTQTYSIGPTGRVDDLPFNTTDFDSGVWQLTMEGTSSKHQAIVYFGIK